MKYTNIPAFGITCSFFENNLKKIYYLALKYFEEEKTTDNILKYINSILIDSRIKEKVNFFLYLV